LDWLVCNKINLIWFGCGNCKYLVLIWVELILVFVGYDLKMENLTMLSLILG
jgi:hypothetical protein